MTVILDGAGRTESMRDVSQMMFLPKRKHRNQRERDNKRSFYSGSIPAFIQNLADPGTNVRLSDSVDGSERFNWLSEHDLDDADDQLFEREDRKQKWR
jgi:hypothetical protein